MDCAEEPIKAARANDPYWRALGNLVVKVREGAAIRSTVPKAGPPGLLLADIVLRIKAPGGDRIEAWPLEMICKAQASGFFKIFCINFNPEMKMATWTLGGVGGSRARAQGHTLDKWLAEYL